MNVEKFCAEDLKDLLIEKKIATMPQMMQELGTQVRHTVIRKLNELESISSYSHRGAYYTIESVANFDQKGLWSFNHVQFSKHGNLLNTISLLIVDSDCGYFLNELESVLQIELRNALLKLVQDNKIKRIKLDGRYFYHSTDRIKAREQLTKRKNQDIPILLQSELRKAVIEPDELKAAIILFFSILSENERRLYSGIESLRIGHGGDRKVANFFGISVDTVAKGKTELLERDINMERIRKPGAGRKEIKKNT